MGLQDLGIVLVEEYGGKYWRESIGGKYWGMYWGMYWGIVLAGKYWGKHRDSIG